ncbi:hypothetical protein EGT74_24605 [Chitinophaga lutea]|uniref:Uncharacterized protein n=1 Tax=Chitinophaga lutea TaxID=2488634 RepID=A0A3N4PMM1_9BACT|nr:hypothetical protein [Chitinophaga lutea]RPE05567.1 hypothetical protein EGT74_24605 [Chitinophaga lutea]
MTNKEMFLICKVSNPDQVDAVIQKIEAGKPRYQFVAQITGVPWFFISVVHQLESGGKFTTHLHNGDPLTARTKKHPAGRPLNGEPPFTWEESAVDALTLMGYARKEAKPGEKKTESLTWGITSILDRLERYNGLGYRKVGIPSPYLWSGSQHYEKGKFVADGEYNPNAVSKQIGAAVILVRMMDRGLIQL